LTIVCANCENALVLTTVNGNLCQVNCALIQQVICYNANVNAQQPRCMFERPVKQRLTQSPEAARRQTTSGYNVYSVLFTCTHHRSVNIVSPGFENFAYPLSFSAFVQGDPLRIYGKALRFLKL